MTSSILELSIFISASCDVVAVTVTTYHSPLNLVQIRKNKIKSLKLPEFSLTKAL